MQALTNPGTAPAGTLPHAGAAPQGRFLVVGTRPRAQRVADRLKQGLDCEVVLHRTLAKAMEHVHPLTLGVALVGPLEQRDAVAATRSLRRRTRSRSVPCFSVLPPGVTDRRARRLYEAGAAVVFEWPRDSVMLPKVVECALRSSDRKRSIEPSSPADRGLARAVDARLRAARRPGDEIRVVVEDGQVTLSGCVPLLRRKRAIFDLVWNIPGVTRLDTSTLRVTRSSDSDPEVLRMVRAVVRRKLPDDYPSMAVDVRDGAVALAGAASDRAAVERTADLLGRLPGVTELRNMLVVTPKPRRNPFLARRLRRVLRQALPGRPVDVSVYDDVAILAGRVATAADKRAAEVLVRHDRDVGRVINQVEIDACCRI